MLPPVSISHFWQTTSITSALQLLELLFQIYTDNRAYSIKQGMRWMKWINTYQLSNIQDISIIPGGNVCEHRKHIHTLHT